CGLLRQTHSEHRSTAICGTAFDLDPVMTSGLAHKRETKPAAPSGLRRTGAPVERPEDLVALAVRYARTMVAHRECGQIAVDLHAYLRAGIAPVTARIVEQVADHPTQQGAVAVDECRLSFDA